MSEFKLSDEVVAHVAKLVQLAILTGTDVVDNLRMVRVTSSENDDDTLVLTPEYREICDNQVKSLMSDVEELVKTAEKDGQAL